MTSVATYVPSKYMTYVLQEWPDLFHEYDKLKTDNASFATENVALKSENDELKRQIADFLVDWKAENDALRAQIVILQDQITALLAKEHDWETQNEALNADVDRLKAQVAQLQSQIADLLATDWQKENDTLRLQIAALQQQIATLLANEADTNELKAQIAELQRQIDSLLQTDWQLENAKLRLINAQLASQVALLQRQNEELVAANKKDKDDFLAQIALLEDHISELQTENNEYRAEIESLDREQDALQQQISDLQTENDDHRAEIEAIDKEKDALQQQILDLQTENNRYRTENDALQQQIKDLLSTDWQKQIDALRRQNVGLIGELEKLEVELEEKIDEIMQLRQRIQELLDDDVTPMTPDIDVIIPDIVDSVRMRSMQMLEKYGFDVMKRMVFSKIALESQLDNLVERMRHAAEIMADDSEIELVVNPNASRRDRRLVVNGILLAIYSAFRRAPRSDLSQT